MNLVTIFNNIIQQSRKLIDSDEFQRISSEQAEEPYASPLYAQDESLGSFPDTLVITAGEDSLCKEGEEFALRLVRAGVAVTAKRFTESIHGFVINSMCGWQEAMLLIAQFTEQHLER